MQNLLVPTSIQRIRSFLIESSGMKVKPWASVEETLAALHATLIARQQCGGFWNGLRVLLGQLASDLKSRGQAEPAGVIDNELLDPDRYQALLDEIRSVLASEASQTSSFPRLAKALSAPALALLLLLGGVATVSCDSQTLRQSNPKQDSGATGTEDAAWAPDLAPDVAPAGPDLGVDATVVPAPDARPDLGPDTLAPSEMVADAARDGSVDVRDAADALVLRDAIAPTSSDGAVVTIQDIMQACNVPSAEQTAIVACLTNLRTSWNKGVPAALAGLPCDTVSSMLNCFQEGNCGNPPTSADFNAATAFRCMMPIYIGVRFA
jgi:hypothetical protein